MTNAFQGMMCTESDPDTPSSRRDTVDSQSGKKPSLNEEPLLSEEVVG